MYRCDSQLPIYAQMKIFIFEVIKQFLAPIAMPPGPQYISAIEMSPYPMFGIYLL